MTTKKIGEKIACKKPFGKKIKLDYKETNAALEALGFNVQGYMLVGAVWEHEELVLELELEDQE
jgi:hypothetical protein